MIPYVLCFILWATAKPFAGPNILEIGPGLGGGVDTAKQLFAFTIRNSPILEGLKTVDVFDIKNNVLYLVAGDRLIQLDLTTGEWRVNQQLSIFLKKALKEGNGVTKLVAWKGQYFMSSYHDLFQVTAAGIATRIISAESFIKNFQVKDDGNILFTTRDSIELCGGDGRRILTEPLLLSDDAGFRNGQECLGYAALPSDSIKELNLVYGKGISLVQYAPLSMTAGIEEPYLSYIAKGYFICFPYLKRNTIYVLKKSEVRNAVYEKIDVKGGGFVPDSAQLDFEEGYPGLRITWDQGHYYIINFMHGKLTISTFDIR